MNRIKDAFLEYLSIREIEVTDKEHCLEMLMQLENTAVCLHCIPRNDFLIGIVNYPLHVPDNRLGETMTLLNETNEHLRFGCFFLAPDKGTVHFRVVMLLAHTSLTPETFDNFMGMILPPADKLYPRLMMSIHSAEATG